MVVWIYWHYRLYGSSDLRLYRHRVNLPHIQHNIICKQIVVIPIRLAVVVVWVNILITSHIGCRFRVRAFAVFAVQIVQRGHTVYGQFNSAWGNRTRYRERDHLIRGVTCSRRIGCGSIANLCYASCNRSSKRSCSVSRTFSAWAEVKSV